MSLELKKIEIGSLVFSGSQFVPVIVVTLDGSETTYQNVHAFWVSTLLPEIEGITPTISIMTNVQNTTQAMAALMHYNGGNGSVYGDANGFSFTRRVQNYTIEGYSRVRQVDAGANGPLYYKGQKIGVFGTVGAHGYPMIVPWIIYVDENDHPYIWSSSNNSAPNMIYQVDNPGVSDANDVMPACYLSSDYTLWQQGNATFTTPFQAATTLTVTDDIQNRHEWGKLEDPYSAGGYAGPDDGETGSYDYIGDPQPFGNVPAGLPSGLDTGFFTLYNPTTAELRNLAGYLWSNNFDLDLFKKLFNNPMDLFLNLGVVPVDIPAGQSKEVGIGLISTGIYMTTAAQRYINKDMGTVHITPTFNAYLDYSPYIRADIILPYIGVVPIDIDAIMGMDINIQYNIDILSGTCVAGINKKNPKDTANGWHCIGTYAGNAMQSYPLTGADYSTLMSGLIQTAGAIAAGAASGGSSGAIAGGLSAASSAVVNEGKPMIQKGGALSSAAGFLLTQQKPVIIISLPYQCLPSLQISEVGYGAYTSDKPSGNSTALKLLGEYKGFIKVSHIHLNNMPFTSSEIDELDSILKGGVYV